MQVHIILLNIKHVNWEHTSTYHQRLSLAQYKKKQLHSKLRKKKVLFSHNYQNVSLLLQYNYKKSSSEDNLILCIVKSECVANAIKLTANKN